MAGAECGLNHRDPKANVLGRAYKQHAQGYHNAAGKRTQWGPGNVVFEEVGNCMGKLRKAHPYKTEGRASNGRPK